MLLILLHVGALALTFLLPLPWIVVLVLWLMIIASLGWSLSRALLKWGAIVELIEEVAGEWTLCDAAGNSMRVHLLPGSYVHSQLVVLNFARLDKRWHRYRVVILDDMLNTDSFRHLRVRLFAVSHRPPEPE